MESNRGQTSRVWACPPGPVDGREVAVVSAEVPVAAVLVAAVVVAVAAKKIRRIRI